MGKTVEERGDGVSCVGDIARGFGGHRRVVNRVQRPHCLIEPLAANTNSGDGVIRRGERLGGILNPFNQHPGSPSAAEVTHGNPDPPCRKRLVPDALVTPSPTIPSPS